MDRSTFIKTMGLFSLGMSGFKYWVNELKGMPEEDIMQPVLFIGHGSPMNAIENNDFTRMLSALGKSLSRPKAILVISAHWLTRGSFVSTSLKPETMYDFGGFPKELYQVKYNSPGAPEYAKMTKDIVKYSELQLDDHWGLDHGCWSVLNQMYPVADIPVFQMSLDYKKDMLYHYELAADLKALRKKGVLIIGSGNVTHNLGRIDWDEKAKPFDWAMEFDEKVRTHFLNKTHSELINYTKWGSISQMAHPSNDHYLPLLYTAGLQDKQEEAKFIFEGFQYGSLSMRCIKIG
jgi:4,5-DOPA dioxygenase extradiol